VVSSASSSAAPDCLLCCFPITSFCVATCQHSAQICGTCILRVQLFVNKKPKQQEEAAAAAAAAAPRADLLNEDNDFKPSPAAVAAAEARKHRCPYCQSAWNLVLITREYDPSSSNPREHPPSAASFGMSTDSSRYPLTRWVYDAALNVYFENAVTRNKYLMMQSLYCVLCFNLADAFRPNGPAAKKFEKVTLYDTLAALEAHLKKDHQRFLCSACTTTRKIFIHEQQVFTHRELLQHFQYGSNEKTVTEHEPLGHLGGIIEPHPFCPFCNKPFFTSDELYVHLTTDHRSCRFCSTQHFTRYFRTEAALRAHFTTKHYLCTEGKCKQLDANHAAFRDMLAYRAHMLKSHTDSLSKQEIKELQTIDLDLFRSGGNNGGVMSRMAGGRASARGNKPEDEYEFSHSADAPARPPAFEDDPLPAEDFPSLGGGAGYAGPSGSGDARSRYAASLSAPAGIPRSRSQPMQLNQAGGRPPFALESREEAFPSLGSSAAGPPLAHASGPGTAPTDGGFRVRGPPPPLNEFPTLRQVTKQEAKQAKKQEAKQAEKKKQGKDGAAAAPAVPAASPSPPPDMRTNLSVPLPLPDAVPAADVAARNKALVALVKAALRQDPDSFETFKLLGQRYRDGQITAEKYLQRFENLFARNPNGAADTERLLVELCALLPDEALRTSLHAEYAKAKVTANMEKLKEKAKEKAAAAAAAEAASAAAAPSYAAPKPQAAASVPSFARVANPGKLTVVQTKGGKSGVSTQGIGAFEGVAVRPLRRDDEDSGSDFLSAMASKAAEKEKKEKAEREAQANRDDKPPPGMGGKPKLGWAAGGDSAAALAGPSGRAPPGLSGSMGGLSISHSSSSPALSNLSRQNSSSNTWSALNGDDDEPSQIAEPIGTAGPSGRGKAQRAAAAGRRSPSPSPSRDYDPPLQSASATASVQLPDSDEVEQHVLRISSLRVAPAAKAPLELLALLFQHVCALIEQRHGAINAPANRRHLMSEQARLSLNAMLRQTRWVHALEFSRASRLGLTPGSVQVLGGLAGRYSRYGGDLGGEQCLQVLSSMSAPELFLLLEYLHGVLMQLTKPTHPDLREAEAAFAAYEERRQRQNEMFKGRQVKPLQRDEDKPAAAAAEDLYERPGAASAAAAASAPSDGPSKKQKKQKVLLFRSGGL